MPFGKHSSMVLPTGLNNNMNKHLQPSVLLQDHLPALIYCFTAAFTEQYCSIVWHQMHHERLSKHLDKVTQAYLFKDKKTKPDNRWTKQVILLLWKDTHSLCIHHNG